MQQATQNLLLDFDLVVILDHVKFCIGTQKHTYTVLNIIWIVDSYKNATMQLRLCVTNVK